jgi:H+-translocating NAD(P) transhydrogenase subunit beta
MSRADWIGAAYLVAAVCFILGLRGLAGPATARKGNQVAAVGMAIAIAATLFDPRVTAHSSGYAWIAVGAAVGGIGGAVGARMVKMTAMPQMVALFNGLGGGAAALVAFSDYHTTVGGPGHVPAKIIASILFSAAVGAISFSGSMIAFGKLQELIGGAPYTLPGQRLLTGGLTAVILALAIYLGTGHENQTLLVIAMALSLVLGVQMVMAIGGADMPVVISLLNAFTGLATASTGFVLSNNVLIIAGTLVGASGTLLTQMMGRAMNRSIGNVVFGAFGTGSSGAVEAGPGAAAGSVRSTTADDVAVMLAYARRVVVVPGYGLAVAQAQHTVRELADLLEKRGVDVRYAIHPVAGRMPGHMNVLLAEADVPYGQLYEMDDINPDFPRTDVSLVIGANDVVNPAAHTNPGSPIYGMPILNVDQSASVVVLKRSMNTGFAGIENELFYDPKTQMLFGDAKQSLQNLVASVKQV